MRPLILAAALCNLGRKLREPSIYRAWRSIFIFTAVLFTMSAALCGCRIADVAAPVEDAAQEAGYACYFPVEHSTDYAPADSSATCWDGSRPHMVAIAWRRAPGRDCSESAHMGRSAQRWYGCSRAPMDTIPL